MTNRNRQFVRTPRRARQWAITNSNGTIVAATQAGMLAINLLALFETDIGAELMNVTISALNYNINYRLTSSTAGDDLTIACGVIIVSEDAFGEGGAALPRPSADHSDWMFNDIRTLTSTQGTDIDEQVPGSFLEIRNKSMRKMRENHSVLAMIFSATLLQPTSVQIFIGGRCLVLLP